jgi:16S rRNA (guanine527-N7)-methyltransferase
MLDASRISALLAPFLEGAQTPAQLIPQLQTYLDLLLRWNARMNLTAVRDPEEIVTRHFGESLFAGRVLLQSGAFTLTGAVPTLVDIGSGPGFPGIPIKLLVPDLRLTLIESQHKKATFLREVIRTLALSHVEVFCGRAESWGKEAQAITMRAVEDFGNVLHTAGHLIVPGGLLCLLIGKDQTETARQCLERRCVDERVANIPNSAYRVVYLTRDSSGN